MSANPVSLDAAVEASRTGDLWLFRGHTAADRAIQTLTNSPVNHVGMALVVDDLPPMLWHAELGRSLPDRWTGDRHRGVQLHDLRAAVELWGRRYGQRAWLRQLEPEVSRVAEDAALRTVARLDGTPFPSTAQLAGRWLRGRVPGRARGGRPDEDGDAIVADEPDEPWFAAFPWHADTPRPRDGSEDHPREPGTPATRRRRARVRRSAETQTEHAPDEQHAVEPAEAPQLDERGSAVETAYCAEVVAITYQAMGLLPAGRRPNWYDPGRFWSGDELPLAPGYALGAEIAVDVPL
jgi:hypothetical protein